jgi:hypothetical protein
MVTLSIIVMDTLIRLTQGAPTRVFITSAWLKLDESKKWIQGFVETMLQLQMLHLGDLDTQVRPSATASYSTKQTRSRALKLEIAEYCRR